ncbi:hypothetical protein FFE93_010400 [Yersinia sp. KBS0713]|nr:hypothetical protein FFE93_010400 [Yersinia sp. KBS0713]
MREGKKRSHQAPEVVDTPILSLRNWRGDCTDGRSDGSRRYDPFGTFPRLSFVSSLKRSY